MRQEDAKVAEQLPVLYCGVRLTRKTLPNRRRLDDGLTVEIAKQLQTNVDSLQLGKKLFDRSEPTVAKVRAAMAAVTNWFRNPEHTLPWPEPGVRLLLREKKWLDEKFVILSQELLVGDYLRVAYFDGKQVSEELLSPEDAAKRVQNSLTVWQTEMMRRISNLQQAAREMADSMPELVERQRQRLGRAFREADYMFNPRDLADVEISFPLLQPDPALAAIDPATFQAERARFQKAYEESVALEKQRLAEELVVALSGLSRALSDRRSFRGHELIAAQERGDTTHVVYLRNGEVVEEDVPTEIARVEIVGEAAPRRVHRSTALKLYHAMQAVQARRQELGIGSESLDNAVASLEGLLRSYTAEGLLQQAKTSVNDRNSIATRCALAAAQLLESPELAPRRAIIRRRWQASQEEASCDQ